MPNNLYNLLRKRIVNIQYKPGDPLPENKLTKEFGVSRTPVREALIRLSEQNLVTIIPNSGARVSDLNLHDFQQLIELRLILEQGVARLAVKNATRKNIQDLEQLREKIRQIGEEDVNGLIDADTRFHEIIGQASQNPFLAKSLSTIRCQFTRIQKLISNKPDGMQSDIPKAIKALEEKDTDGMIRLMEQHVEHFVDKLRGYFKI